MGGIEQVAHDAGAVIHMGGEALVGQHHQHGGGAVEGVGVRVAHDGRVHSAQPADGLPVLHRHDHRGLCAPSGGCVGTGLQHGFQFGVGDLFVLVAAAAAALSEDLQRFQIHHKK